MSITPPNVESVVQENWSTKENFIQAYMPRNQQLVKHLITGGLTTNGIQWSAYTCTTAVPTSKSSYTVTVGSTYTASWPGLSGFYLQEMEAGLTAGMISTNVRSTAGGTTVGYRWEYKDDDATTWQALSTWKNFKVATSTASQRTVSGYASLGTGYNKIPVSIRLRAYAKTNKAKFRIKSSSYIAITAKKSAS